MISYDIDLMTWANWHVPQIFGDGPTFNNQNSCLYICGTKNQDLMKTYETNLKNHCELSFSAGKNASSVWTRFFRLSMIKFVNLLGPKIRQVWVNKISTCKIFFNQISSNHGPMHSYQLRYLLLPSLNFIAHVYGLLD